MMIINLYPCAVFKYIGEAVVSGASFVNLSDQNGVCVVPFIYSYFVIVSLYSPLSLHFFLLLHLVIELFRK